MIPDTSKMIELQLYMRTYITVMGCTLYCICIVLVHTDTELLAKALNLNLYSSTYIQKDIVK